MEQCWPRYSRPRAVQQESLYLQGLAALAQLVERLTRNEKVEGSIPSGGSKNPALFRVSSPRHKRPCRSILIAMSEKMSTQIGEAQAWFWAEEWQAGEKEADNHLQRGEGEVFSSGEEFLESLK